MYLTEEEVCAGFSQRLAQILKERGLSISAVAEGVRSKGTQLSDVAVRKWLSSGRISEPNLLVLAEFLDMTPWQLRYGVAANGSTPEPSLAVVAAQNTARRIMVAEILGAQERLETLCETLRLSLWEYDLLTAKMVIAGDTESIYGCESHDLGLNTPDDLRRLIHPNDRNLFTNAWSSALNGSTTFSMPLRIRWNEFEDGQCVNAWVSPRRAKKDGAITSITGVFALPQVAPWTGEEKK